MAAAQGLDADDRVFLAVVLQNKRLGAAVLNMGSMVLALGDFVEDDGEHFVSLSRLVNHLRPSVIITPSSSSSNPHFFAAMTSWADDDEGGPVDIQTLTAINFAPARGQNKLEQLAAAAEIRHASSVVNMMTESETKLRAVAGLLNYAERHVAYCSVTVR